MAAIKFTTTIIIFLVKGCVEEVLEAARKEKESEWYYYGDSGSTLAA